jgi:DNA-binding SARP family transcriptional activator/tetratricopeptide (TPR) repeat protein
MRDTKHLREDGTVCRMQPLRVGVLGPLVARRDGAPVALGSPMLRNLLGLLAVQPHQVVSRDEIVDTLWGEDPPRTCLASIHVYIGRLRTLAEPSRARREHGLISAVGNRGYVFEPNRDQLDLLEFTELAERAESAMRAGAPREVAARALSDALRCWRGPALAGMGERLESHPAVVALSDRRTAMALTYADTTLRLLGAAPSPGQGPAPGQGADPAPGHGAGPAAAPGADPASGPSTGPGERQPPAAVHREQVLGLLRELAHDQPMHEGVHARLMLMLAASGQQAAALLLYAELRTRLDEDLGVDPGADLVDAHLRVLRHEVVGPDNETAGTQVSDGPVFVSAKPAQLPLDVRPFTGRSQTLRELDESLTGTATATTVPVVVLSGTAGVGKSALAVHWAHQASAHFPDGQIFVSLRGYARTPPLQPIDALAQVLRSLGVPAEQIPVDADEAANLYRSLLTGKRLLVVLDNANRPEQVRPLLPGNAGCAVLVTSRDRLAGLAARDGAHRISLDVLTEPEAEALLARTVGSDRVWAEPEATADLARTCAYLPLALRIAAANLQSRPHQPIAGYVARLRAENPVSALAVDGDEEAAVRGAFDLSYRALPAPAQQLFRLLGLAPGQDMTEEAVAALAGLEIGETIRLLDTLSGAHLASQHAGGRYGLHDLLRAYAAGQAEAEDTEADRSAGAERLLGWYQRGVTGAMDKLYPERLRLPGPGDADPDAFSTASAALAWLDAERLNLLAAARDAAEHGPRQAAWLLMDALRAYCSQRMSTVDWLTLIRAGMSAAERADDPLGQAAAYLNLGEIGLRRGEYSQAIIDYRRVVELSRRAGWLGGEAAALGNLGLVCTYTGRVEDAVDYLMESLELTRRTGRVASQAITLGTLGAAHRDLGNLDLAADHLVKAMDLFRSTGSVGGQAIGLDNLGEVYCAQGRLDEAATCYGEALTLFRRLGSRVNEAAALRGLAAVQCERGHTDAALDLALRALDISREMADRRFEIDALNILGTIHHRDRRGHEARGYYQHALRLARDTGHRYPEAVSLVGLAELHQQLEEPEQAVNWAEQALTVIAPCGYRLLEPRATAIAALPAFALSDRE